MKYTWIMERIADGHVIREQCKADSVTGVKSVIRAYKMAGLGWKIADLRYNARVLAAIKDMEV